MGITSPWLLISLIPLFFLYRRQITASPWSFLAALNLIFISVISPWSAVSWLVLGAITYSLKKAPARFRALWIFAMVVIFVTSRLQLGNFKEWYPLGYSFVFLQHLTFLIKSKSTEVQKISLLEFFGSAHLFANLQSGPVADPTVLVQQAPLKNLLDFNLVREALILIFLGFCKKGVADFFAIYADELYREPSWRAAISLFVRYYLDFSGYSDTAVGVGLMFGVRLPINFNLPYISQSIAEYWRRWHISMGDWFRGHVFYPLQYFLTRKEQIRTSPLLLKMTLPIASFTTMFLIGLWHGLTDVFFVWAFFNAVLILISGSFADWLRKLLGVVAIPVNIIITVYLIFVGQVMINAPNLKKFWKTYSELHFGPSTLAPDGHVPLIFFGIFLIYFFHGIDHLVLHQKIWKSKLAFYLLLASLMIFSLITFKPGQPFIYGSF